MTMQEKITRIKNHLEWLYDLYYEKDRKRLQDQAYGFIQGVQFFDDELYEEINKQEIWSDFWSRTF